MRIIFWKGLQQIIGDRREHGTEMIFEEIIAESIQNLVENKNIQGKSYCRHCIQLP